MSAFLYLEHLSDGDLALLASVWGNGDVRDLLTYFREDPGRFDVLLRNPTTHDTLFGSGEREAFLRASPFLMFAVLTARAADELAETSFVQEWIGPGRRVPMFEVLSLREFLADSARRLFLAELLASYTRVASGSVWVQTTRGWRRRRYSELDPLRLIEMARAAPAHEKPFLHRRLGDLALFLTGVFPDYAGTLVLPGLRRQRLERVLRIEIATGSDSPHPAEHLPGDLGLLEQVGRHGYRQAWRATEGTSHSPARVLGELASEFGHARRTLNFLTDRYLFPIRDEWFPVAEG